MEVFVSAEYASSCFDVTYGHVSCVAVLEAVSAEGIFVLMVHSVDSATLVGGAPHELLWWVHAGKEGSGS